MSKFCITFHNDTSELELIFDLFDYKIANRWADLIKKNQKITYSQFQSWPNSGKTLSYFVDKLNTLIYVINEFEYLIPEIVTLDNINQERLNYLHKFFEVFTHDSIPNNLCSRGTPEVRKAIYNLNIIIHECEDYVCNQNKNYPSLVTSFENQESFPFEDEDYRHFTCQWNFGTVYINNCQTGKTVFDVFKDKDILPSEELIAGTRCGANFIIKFGKSTTEDIYRLKIAEFNDWYKKQSKRYTRLGVGFIPVAKLNLKLSGLVDLEHTHQLLGQFNSIRNICIR